MSTYKIDSETMEMQELADVAVDAAADAGGGIDSLIAACRRCGIPEPVHQGFGHAFDLALDRGLLRDLVEYYSNETGLSPTRGRARLGRIADHLWREGLRLDQIELEEHNDHTWRDRRNRTPREKRADVIGSTNSRHHGHLVSMWWVMPKAEVTS